METKTFVLNTHVAINVESCSDASCRRTDQFIRAQVQWQPASDRTVSMKYGRQSTQGYAQGSRLSVDRCASYKQDGNARQTRGFIQVRPP